MGFNLDDYEPVEVRIAKFWADHPQGRISTTLEKSDGTEFIIRAEVYRDASDAFPFATGYAQEIVSQNPKTVNYSSALENGETSAIGRALANGGYASKGKRPSREEMSKVQRRQEPDDIYGELSQRLMALNLSAEERKELVLDATGRTSLGSIRELDEDEVVQVHRFIDRKAAVE